MQSETGNKKGTTRIGRIAEEEEVEMKEVIFLGSTINAVGELDRLSNYPCVK